MRKDAPAAETPAPKPSGTTLAAAAARRNENVAVNRIDTDVLKESNVRLGVNYTILPVPLVERSYYTAEHGRPPSELSVLKPAPLASVTDPRAVPLQPVLDQCLQKMVAQHKISREDAAARAVNKDLFAG